MRCIINAFNELFRYSHYFYLDIIKTALKVLNESWRDSRFSIPPSKKHLYLLVAILTFYDDFIFWRTALVQKPQISITL